MAKSKSNYVCQSCGDVTHRWAGKCEACGAWNSIVEETSSGGGFASGAAHTRTNAKARPLSTENLREQLTPLPPRYHVGIQEFDRVCGGGLVPGSVILIGGDPGIGKSTLLLQIACALTRQNVNALYVSGEEGMEQIRLRAQRLGLAEDNLHLAAATDVDAILATLDDKSRNIKLVVIDSIQTMVVPAIDSAPGTVTQVRAATHALIAAAKSRNICILLVGHVTKEGQLAGPRVLEHMVDTVLYFEGDRGHQFRILRTVKNRYGPTDEIGVFAMQENGLAEVANPSALFLAQRHQDLPGSAVLASIEGTRPLLVEVQALVASTPFSAPRRACIGWDNNRLAMLLAVLETRLGLSFATYDVYLNIAGGLKITETGADVAVAAALISALRNRAIPEGALFFGEVGLGGEIRPVAQPELRQKEASKLGFDTILMPPTNKQGAKQTDLRLVPLSHVRDLNDWLA
ncbi:MAG: DNA repair protein RadA [Pseudomonadota bacterium]